MVARATFKAVKPQVDIPATEKQVLEFWREQNIFQRSMNERANGPHFVFYEGPPTANGRPGSHHVISRAFKDMFPRYRAMTGCYVLRKGGWDTHGLPVELEVQRQLGFKTKQEVVDYGVAEFNQKCRESVFTYIQEWEELTERIAFWVDMDDAYVTYHNDYIESCWWILKSFWDKELIFQDYKVVPYSPRSGTPYSSHEVSLGYKDVDDPSVYVRFKLNDADNTYFLVWTTTPWTLPGNVALAVGAEVDYVELEGRQSAAAPLEKLILAEALVEAAVTARVQDGGGYQVVRRLKGRELTGLHYEPLYTFLPVEQDYCYVVAGDFVSTEDGTGIVHMAPAFGADDLETGKQTCNALLRGDTHDQSGDARRCEDAAAVLAHGIKHHEHGTYGENEHGGDDDLFQQVGLSVNASCFKVVRGIHLVTAHDDLLERVQSLEDEPGDGADEKQAGQTIGHELRLRSEVEKREHH